MKERSLIGMVLVLVLSTAPALAGNGTLDGKTFDVEVSEPAGEAPEDDQLIFADGMFRSTACEAHGFEAAAYTTGEDEGRTTFQAVASSETEGTNTWSGTVSEGTIEGSFTWTKPGQDPIEYTFQGEIAE